MAQPNYHDLDEITVPNPSSVGNDRPVMVGPRAYRHDSSGLIANLLRGLARFINFKLLDNVILYRSYSMTLMLFFILVLVLFRYFMFHLTSKWFGSGYVHRRRLTNMTKIDRPKPVKQQPGRPHYRSPPVRNKAELFEE